MEDRLFPLPVSPLFWGLAHGPGQATPCASFPGRSDGFNPGIFVESIFVDTPFFSGRVERKQLHLGWLGVAGGARVEEGV